jgi:hypothetical protein
MRSRLPSADSSAKKRFGVIKVKAVLLLLVNDAFQISSLSVFLSAAEEEEAIQR